MAKLTGALLSHSATGQVGKVLTYQQRAGVQLARAYKVSPDPKTAAQLTTRHVFTWLQAAWKLGPTVLRDDWNAYAAGRAVTGRAAFTGVNVAALRNQTGLAKFVGISRQLGALQAPVMVLSPVNGGWDSTLTPPQLPVGWSVISAVWLQIVDQSPQLPFVPPLIGNGDAIAPYVLSPRGRPHGQRSMVCGWFNVRDAKGVGWLTASVTGLVTAI